jgi:chemotaxis protein methyltransferase WspC
MGRYCRPAGIIGGGLTASTPFDAIILERSGLDSDALGRGVITRAVRRRMDSLRIGSHEEYLQRLAVPEELQHLIDEVVVLETSFFRDAGAFSALQDWVRAQWLPRGSAAPLRILSIPSSTGEEPYSIAMCLLDLALPSLRFRIDAIDISARALNRAREGVYGSGSFRGQQHEYRDRYFTKTSAGYQIGDRVQAHVEFRQGNILEPSSVAASYDVIFCRNLLIYFDAEHQKRALDRLISLLAIGGALFLGPAETFLAAGAPLRPVGRPMSFGFIHEVRVNADPPSQLSRTRGMPGAHAGRTTPTASTTRVPPGTGVSPARGTISPRPQSNARAGITSAARVEPSLPASSLEEIESLANAGHVAEAAQRCSAHIAAHGATSDSLFLLGVLSDAMGDTTQAIASFRKVLYLDPTHEQALLHLSVLARKSGSDQARNLDRRARAGRASRTDRSDEDA